MARFDFDMYAAVMQHAVDQSLDDSVDTPQGCKADTYYLENPAPAPTHDELEVWYALQSGQISRQMAELALDALDLKK